MTKERSDAANSDRVFLFKEELGPMTVRAACLQEEMLVCEELVRQRKAALDAATEELQLLNAEWALCVEGA